GRAGNLGASRGCTRSGCFVAGAADERRGRPNVKRALVFIAACLLPVSLAAQAVTGTILGVVTDDTGGVVPGATVTLTNVGHGIVRSVATDAAGEYTAPSLPTG